MMESQGLSTQGTALEGLLQQEREAMEREKVAAAENGNAELAAEIEAKFEAKIEEQVRKQEMDSCSRDEIEGGQSTQTSLRSEVTA